ncbi:MULTISPECIES: class I SAM-dependent methyltransferase [unclassified Methylocaldum]|jgi:ubiquinone/menaquinone biosynthesis C-methylase UbiE|uniref:class I SAM-dependent methyltransferase n=1 Tax=unclassified Methylocaldum TaxID=2622260 RepID=UPI001AE42CC3|nr:class I SAM-dependent methyltransferase [Methylocaldum sp. RMAD-M]MBP1150422.1 ubiquinone/menaquinone biosynthesis C-methylase UbiE [Methylocaldum sp. RMAD-M]MDV3242323.1 class I SAM-dependent methyltransferase [Methylocaldum sp.]
MNEVTAEKLFSGPIGEEYEMLKRICPAAADMSRRVGEFVAGWTPKVSTESLNLLELGCGTGVTTMNLIRARSDAMITAVDNEFTMLSQARRNLAGVLEHGRLRLVENDALSYLQGVPSASIDVVASAYTLHNFLNGYRVRVLEEIFRVLKPGGVFVNGDRYALDDSLTHLQSTQEEVRQYFRTFTELNRIDLLEQWIVHLFSDESPDHVMPLDKGLGAMREIGFDAVTVHFRQDVNALVSGGKPWP